MILLTANQSISTALTMRCWSAGVHSDRETAVDQLRQAFRSIATVVGLIEHNRQEAILVLQPLEISLDA